MTESMLGNGEDASALAGQAPALLFLLSAAGRVLSCNGTAAASLGRRPEQVVGQELARFADGESALRLQRMLATADWGSQESLVELRLQARDGQQLVLGARLRKLRRGEEEVFCLAALEFGELSRRLREITHLHDVLRGLVETSCEPMWCIEYAEPVDITAGDREIIRQVFENECYWGVCNRAFARLYNLPDDLDIRRQPVNLYFPRSPENEAFIQQLIDADFEIDDVLSLDVRHDGRAIYVENTVRCDIRDGRMYRMWGTVRDVTQFKRAQNRLVQMEHQYRDILTAVPDPILVIDRSGALKGANPAFEQLLGWQIGEWLGQDITGIVDLRRMLARQGRMGPGSRLRFSARVLDADGGEHLARVTLTLTTDVDDADSLIAVLRLPEGIGTAASESASPGTGIAERPTAGSRQEE